MSNREQTALSRSTEQFEKHLEGGWMGVNANLMTF